MGPRPMRYGCLEYWTSRGSGFIDFEELLSEDVECKARDELDVVRDDEEAVVADEAVDTAY